MTRRVRHENSTRYRLRYRRMVRLWGKKHTALNGPDEDRAEAWVRFVWDGEIPRKSDPDLAQLRADYWDAFDPSVAEQCL